MSNFAGSSGDVESGSVSDSEETESVVQGPNQGRLLIQKATVYMYIVFIAISQYINLARKKRKASQNKYPSRKKLKEPLEELSYEGQIMVT